MVSYSRATQAERAVAAIRYFLYIHFFLNAPLDLLLDVLTLSRSLAPHFTVVHFIVVRGVVFPLHNKVKGEPVKYSKVIQRGNHHSKVKSEGP